VGVLVAATLTVGVARSAALSAATFSFPPHPTYPAQPTYSGTIHYTRSYTAEDSSQCPTGIDPASETVSEDWTIAFQDADPVPYSQVSQEEADGTNATITGSFSEQVSCGTDTEISATATQRNFTIAGSEELSLLDLPGGGIALDLLPDAPSQPATGLSGDELVMDTYYPGGPPAGPAALIWQTSGDPVIAPGVGAAVTQSPSDATIALNTTPASPGGAATTTAQVAMSWIYYQGAGEYQDTAQDSQLGTLTVQLTAHGGRPVAVCDAYWVKPGHALTVAAPGVLANDVDEDGYPLSAKLDQTSFPVHTHRFSLSSSGAMRYQATRAGSATVIYHDIDSQHSVSFPAEVRIDVTPTKPADLTTCSGTDGKPTHYPLPFKGHGIGPTHPETGPTSGHTRGPRRCFNASIGEEAVEKPLSRWVEGESVQQSSDGPIPTTPFAGAGIIVDACFSPSGGVVADQQRLWDDYAVGGLLAPFVHLSFWEPQPHLATRLSRGALTITLSATGRAAPQATEDLTCSYPDGTPESQYCIEQDIRLAGGTAALLDQAHQITIAEQITLTSAGRCRAMVTHGPQNAFIGYQPRQLPAGHGRRVRCT